MAEKKQVPEGKYDFTLLAVTLILVLIGIVMVFSSSWPQAAKKFNDGYYFFKKQLKFGILGLVLMILAMVLPYNLWKKPAFSRIIYIGSVATGFLIFTKYGVEKNHARRWVQMGALGFMPSDIIKLGSIMFMAYYLSGKKNLDRFFADLVPGLSIIALSCGLIFLQKDMSTTVTLGLALVAMLFIAGAKYSHLIFVGSAAIGLLFSSIYIFKAEGTGFRQERMKTFLNPFEYRDAGGMQLAQGLLAIASGGLFGVGLGQSRQKYFYIPEVHNDFIFAIVGEELGLVGSLSILFLFTILIHRGVTIASKTRDRYGRYLATGITALFAVQSLINIGVVTGLGPTTGIPLPLISYGGTSLVISMVSIGLLLSISKYGR